MIRWQLCANSWARLVWADPEKSVKGGGGGGLTMFFVFFSHQRISQRAVRTRGIQLLLAAGPYQNF